MYVKHLQEYLDKFTDGKKGKPSVMLKYLEMDNGTLRRSDVLKSWNLQ